MFSLVSRRGLNGKTIRVMRQTRLMSNFKVLSDDSAYDKVKEADAKMCFYFTATWCPPCKMIGPILEKEMAPAFEDITFVKIDVDECPDASQDNSISGVPTFQFRNAGKVVDTFVGASPDDITRRLHVLSEA